MAGGGRWGFVATPYLKLPPPLCWLLMGFGGDLNKRAPSRKAGLSYEWDQEPRQHHHAGHRLNARRLSGVPPLEPSGITATVSRLRAYWSAGVRRLRKVAPVPTSAKYLSEQP